jgi:tape measure domain-containing protein
MAAEILRFGANEKEFVAAFERASGALGKFTADMNVKLSKSFQQADRLTSNFNRGFGRLTSNMRAFALQMGVNVTLPALAGLKLGSDNFAELDSLKKGIEAIEGSAAKAEKRTSELFQLARVPALGFQEALKGDVRLRTVNYTLQESTRIMREFANAVARSGGGQAQLGEVTYQLSQAIGKGKLLTQDWRPIIEAAPAVGDALSRMFGTTSIDDIANKVAGQGKSVRQFVNSLLDELERAPRVTDSYKTSLENLQATIFSSSSSIFDLANKSLHLQEKVVSLEKGIQSLADWMGRLPEPTRDMVFQMGVLITATPLAVFALSKLIDVYTAIIKNTITLAGRLTILGGVVMLLGAMYIEAKGYADGFRESTKSVQLVHEDAARSVNTERTALNTLVGAIQKTKVGSDEYLKIKRDILDISPEFGKYLKDTSADFNGLKISAAAYAMSLVAVAEQKMLTDKIVNTKQMREDLSLNRTKEIPWLDDIALFAVHGAFSLDNWQKERQRWVNTRIGTLETQEKKYRDTLEEQLIKNAKIIERFAKPERTIPKDTPLGGTGGQGENTELKAAALAEIELLKDSSKRKIDAIEEAYEEQLDLNKERQKQAKENNKLFLEMSKSFGEQEVKQAEDLNNKIKTKLDSRITAYYEQTEKIKIAKEQLRAEQEALINGAIANLAAGGLSQVMNEESQGFNRALKSQLGALGDYAIKLGLAGQKIVKLKAALFANPGIGTSIALIAGGIALKAMASSIKVNRLAQGGMTNGSPIFSILGDNQSGKEMALPWERTNEFAANIAKYMGGLNGGGGNTSNNVKYARVRGRDLFLPLTRLN